MKELKKTEDPIREFWKWFGSNQLRLRDFRFDPEKNLDEILTSIRRVGKGIAVELEPPQDDGIIKMTISADGNKEFFQEVEELIENAPAIEGWWFIGFRQSVTPDVAKKLALKTTSLYLEPKRMRFTPVVSEDGLSIIVYAFGITKENHKELSHHGLLVLDNLLGEYDRVTKVKSYEFRLMPVDDDEIDKLTPLLELAAFVDGYHLKAV